MFSKTFRTGQIVELCLLNPVENTFYKFEKLRTNVQNHDRRIF